MKKKIFAMSDIHGCYDELMALYRQLPINPKKDILVICGDVVDRGPKSKQVVQQLIDWKKKYPHWQFLYGNHEDLMLDALLYGGRIYNSYSLWYGQGGRETFYSYIDGNLSDYEKQLCQPKDVIPKEHIEFLASLPRYYETKDYIFVHGGLKPGKTAEDTNPQDLIWIRDEFLNSNYDWGKKIIHGHTPASDLEPDVQKNRIGIDTAVCYSANNKLTCIELPIEKFYFQENLKKLPPLST